jgi:enoyl-CoA hydratase/carnithine racemase
MTGATWFSLCCSRGRYFLLTGEKIAASVAKMLGLVGKVLPRDKVLPRAW